MLGAGDNGWSESQEWFNLDDEGNMSYLTPIFGSNLDSNNNDWGYGCKLLFTSALRIRFQGIETLVTRTWPSSNGNRFPQDVNFSTLPRFETLCYNGWQGFRPTAAATTCDPSPVQSRTIDEASSLPTSS